MRLLNAPWLQQIRDHTLTDREEEIIQHLANADYRKDIAKALRISVKTVETHCHNIRQKWRVRNQAALYQQAYLYVHAEDESGVEQPWILSRTGTG